MNKTLIKWPGGKSSEIRQFVTMIPDYDRYVEPFAGGAALYFYLRPMQAVLNDNSRNLMDFYEDFNEDRAYGMLSSLDIDPDARLKTLSKGTKEKVQLILVMSREAELYILDEPIAGVDPAARDFILRTIITNYNENATILLSTHLITDIENILDEVIFMKNGSLLLHTSADAIREKQGKSIDTYFREVYAC